MTEQEEHDKNDKKLLKAGPLHSDLNIALHTTHAINLWNGKNIKKTDGRRLRIIGMPEVISRIAVASRDSHDDNPYADAMLFDLEEMLTAVRLKIDMDIAHLDKILKDLPGSVSVSDVCSHRPLEVGVYSSSPVGYLCVWLLVSYDYLVKKVYQVFHYGLISRKNMDSLLYSAFREVKKIYSFVRKYRSFRVTRNDIFGKTTNGKEIIQRFGEPDTDILFGKKRSSFSGRLIIRETKADKISMSDLSDLASTTKAEITL